MFRALKFFIVFITSFSMYSQVGINTTLPTASLDVNGDLRLRVDLEESNIDVSKDSVLVISRDGTVKRIPSKKIVNSALVSAVKGNFSTTGSVGISLGVGLTYTTIPFNSEQFDYNDEFDTATNIFTAKQDGLYDVGVQINSSGALPVSTNYGVCIIKNGSVVAQENYSNISGFSINLTPPVRKAKTIVKLSAGDTIYFQIYSNLTSVNLVGDAIDSYFTIVQIR